MSAFDPNRREALKRIALLGAAGLVADILPVRPARAADLTVGFVYIGPRMDWGWNESHARAAAALMRVPNVSVVEAGYLPESTDYGSGKDTPETSLHQGDGGLDRRWCRPDLFDVVRRRSFPSGDGGEVSQCRVPPSLAARQRHTRRMSAAKTHCSTRAIM